MISKIPLPLTCIYAIYTNLILEREQLILLKTREAKYEKVAREQNHFLAQKQKTVSKNIVFKTNVHNKGFKLRSRAIQQPNAFISGQLLRLNWGTLDYARPRSDNAPT